jgi:hypothetical protein
MTSRKNSSRRTRRASSSRLIESLENRLIFNTTLHDLSAGNFSQNWTNTALIGADDDWSGVASIVGYRGDNNAVLTGADPQTVLLPNAVVDVNANRNDPDTFLTGGVVEFELADPVVALQGSGTADAPHLVIYLNASGRENVVVSYNLRDIDAGADTNQQFALQYRVGGTGDFVNVPAGYVADASNGGSTPVSVQLPAGVNGQSNVEVRIITTNAGGNDEFVGIDDISVTSDASSSQFVGFTTASGSVAETGPSITIPVTRGVATTGTVTVQYNTSDLSAVVGSDYSNTSGTLTFLPGDATENIVVPITNDSDVEPIEQFKVTLSNATGATLGGSEFTVTINDLDKPTTGKLLSAGALTQDWSDTQKIINNADWTGVAYTFGYTGTDLTAPAQVPGEDPQTILEPRTDTLSVLANGIDPSTTFNGGVGEFDQLIDPTVALNGAGAEDAPFLLFEVDTTGISSFDVSYNLRDLDGSTDNSIQRVALQYRVGNTGDFTNVANAFVADATTGPGQATLVTPVSTTISGAVANQPLVQVRIITADAVGNDEWVGVDDIVIAQTPAAPGNLTFATSSITVNEDAGTATVDVVRVNGSTGQVTVNFNTANGSATEPGDYTNTSGTLTFANGDTQESFTVPIVNDTTAEVVQNFTVNLSSPGGGAGLGLLTSATISIIDNDIVKLNDGPLSQDWNDTNAITVNDNWGGVLGIRGYRGDGMASEAENAQNVLDVGTDTPIDVIANQLNPDTVSDGGLAEFDQLIDPTVALQGSGTADAPFLLAEFDTTGVAAVEVSYRLVDIDGSADNAIQQVALQYRIGNSGTWSNVPAAYIADATGAGTGTTNMVNVTVGGAVANQPLVQFRILTVNAAGNDEWVGVDDIVFEEGVAPALPAWLDPASLASWDDPSQTLTVSGLTTIIANPQTSGDTPIINASGPAAVLEIDPDTDLQIHAASMSLVGGATAEIVSLGGLRTASNHRVLVLTGLSIDSTSTLDITDNDVVVNYTGDTVIAGVEADVANGYNVVGDWLGEGITSSVAAADGNFAVGVADNAALAAPFGTAQSGPLFAGVDVDATTVLIKFTHRADVTLDGLVDPNDASVFGTNYSENDFANWALGDMDYDGLFTPNDASIFGTFYDESLPQV